LDRPEQEAVDTEMQPAFSVTPSGRRDDLAGELVEISSNAPHEAIVMEDLNGIDIFSPICDNWRDKTGNYLRKANQAK
jgi:hypothetical protein